MTLGPDDTAIMVWYCMQAQTTSLFVLSLALITSYTIGFLVKKRFYLYYAVEVIAPTS